MGETSQGVTSVQICTPAPNSQDYPEWESSQYFPGCNCGHDATEHAGGWGDWREGYGCLFPGCPCEVEWECA